MQPESEAYVRQVRRHLGALPRKVRPLIVHELGSHADPTRLGPPREVARALVEGWLEAREATRSPRQLLGQAWRGGAWAAGLAGVPLIGLTMGHGLLLWGEAMPGHLAEVELLTLPPVIEVWAPTLAFCFGLGALIRLGRECGPATYMRLAPLAARAIAAASVALALAIFGLQEAVVVPANRAVVDAVQLHLVKAPSRDAWRSPQELTLAQVWARRGQGTAARQAQDARGLRVKLALPASAIPLALFGMALGVLATRLRWPRWAALAVGTGACGAAACAEVALMAFVTAGPWLLALVAGVGAIAAALRPLAGWPRRRAVV